MSIEEPKFTLALKDGAFELRDYVATIVAEVTASDDRQKLGRKGFALLGGFVFGGNRARTEFAKSAVPVADIAKDQKIVVTAPVTRGAGGGDWLVRFTMPGHFALTDLPRSIDPAVTLRALPPVRLAVLRFSGLVGEAKVVAMTQRLRTMVKQRGLVPVGPSSIARYNPPWTPWFLRRNEVMVPVGKG